MLLPGPVLPFPFPVACCLEFIESHLRPHRGGQYPRNTKQCQRWNLGPWCQSFMSLFTDLLWSQAGVWKPLNQIFFSSLIFPKFKVARFYNFISTKNRKKNPVICILDINMTLCYIFFISPFEGSCLDRYCLNTAFFHVFIHKHIS